MDPPLPPPSNTSTLLKSKLEEVTSFFQNPFGNEIGGMIDTATTPSTLTPTPTQPTPLYPLLLPICDLLNSSPSSSTLHSQYLKAVKKKLGSKSEPTLALTLDLIEVTVKNCAQSSPDFVGVVLDSGLLTELVRVMATTPPTTTNRILTLIQSLADTFKSNSSIQGLYAELSEKGIEFPPVDFDGGLVPIIMKPNPHPKKQDSHLHPVAFSKISLPSPSQKDKILSDLRILQGNLDVLNEVVSEGVRNTGEVEEDEEEAWTESLHVTILAMQGRLTSLLSQITDDELLRVLLDVNDELNGGLLRYARWVKNKNQARLASDKELIDFGGGKESTEKEGAVPRRRIVGREEPDVEDDIDPDLATQILQNHTESDFSEMEAWLESCFPTTQPTAPRHPRPLPANINPTPKEELTSSEFDLFLQERCMKK